MTVEITIFKSRTTKKGVIRSMTWEGLKDRLRKPKITTESIGEYFDMTNEQRTEIKDVGGFVGGRLRDGVRNKNALENRTVLTIDEDHAKPDSVETFMLLNNVIFCCHTTHSHTAENPRLRWVFPLSRPVSPEEYVIVAREVCSWIGPGVDDTTDQPERLMFWSSCAFDSDFEFWEGGQVLLDPDKILDQADFSAVTVLQEEHISKIGEVEVLSIEEGERNKKVFSFAASLRSKGLDRDDIRQMVGILNESSVHPPLPEAELDTICRSVCNSFRPGDSLGGRLRDAWEDFADLGPRGEAKKPGPKKEELPVLFTWYDLDSRQIEAPKFAVPGLIPYGLTVLAAPPKYGKSWFCIDLAISVATGTPFMGQEVQEHDALYLALEDGVYRLQQRSRKVANGRPPTTRLYFSERAPMLNEGLIDWLREEIRKIQGDVGLLIIDTLQKIRGVAGKTEGVYGYDYRELGLLHDFALEQGLALVLVHHLNKGGDDSDPIARVNGSTGITGAADSIVTLTRVARSADETKMTITGRDVQERTLIVQMDPSNYRWISLGEERDVEKDREAIEFKADPIVKTILWHLAEAEDLAQADGDHEWPEAVWCCTSQELRDEVKRLFGQEYDNANSVGHAVKKLAPQLEAREGISYEYRRTNAARKHVFKREII